MGFDYSNMLGMNIFDEGTLSKNLGQKIILKPS